MRPSLAALFLTVFIDLMGFGIVIPLLPLYAERLQATAFEAAALLAVYSLMQLLFAPVWGRLSDRVGRRPVILVSVAGSALSYLMLAAAASVNVLFLARILAGIAGANIPVAQAYIADVTEGPDRARGMGLIGAAFGLGMVIGPALGGALSLVGARVPELFAAALCLANVVLAAVRLPESLPAARRADRPFRHPLAPASLRQTAARQGVSPLLATFFLVTLGFAVLEGTFSLTAHRWRFEPSRVAVLWLYMGVVAVIVQGLVVGRLARRVPERVLVSAGVAALGAGLAWIPFTRGSATLLAALGLVVSGQGLAGPSLASLVSKAVEAGIQGETLGVSQSLSAASRVIGPAAGGLILERLGIEATFLAAALCAAGALAISLPAAGAERAALGARPSGSP